MVARANPLTVLFSGGGTAGHLAPGFALAHALAEQGVRSVFATPGEAVEASWFAGQVLPRRVRAVRLPRTVPQALGFAGALGTGVNDALKLLRRERVDGVVALGGWPCAPAALAARLCGLPLAFVVSDAVAGAVVRRLGWMAGRIYVAQAAAAQGLGTAPRVRVTGTLLRPGVLQGRRDAASFGLDPKRRTLLVIGGSLGARGLNERMLGGLEAAVAQDPDLCERMQVLQAAGEQAAQIAEAYAALGLRHHVAPYLVRMADAYALADLVVARAGANTCAEIHAMARPAVFVPYPHHADRQQFKNAAPLAQCGGAELVPEEELTPERVRGSVLDLLFAPDTLAGRARALDGTWQDGSAETAADWLRFLGAGARRRSLDR